MTPNPITTSRERIVHELVDMHVAPNRCSDVLECVLGNAEYQGTVKINASAIPLFRNLKSALLQHEAVVREEMARKLKKMLHPKPRCYCREFSMGDHECVYTSNNAVNDCISAVRTTPPAI